MVLPSTPDEMSEEAATERLTAFIEAALLPAADHRAGTLDRAKALLDDDPSIATASIHAAAMLGEVEAVEAFLAHDPRLAVAVGGPRGWDLATIRLLVERGADGVNGEGLGARDYATRAGHDAVAELLREHET